MGLGTVGVVLCLGVARIWRRVCRCMRDNGLAADFTKDRTADILMTSRLNGEHDGLGKH